MTMLYPRKSRRGSERGSLPLALLVVIIAAGVVVVLVSRTIGTQSQVRFDQGFHAALPPAEAGVNLGKFWLNDGEVLLECTEDDVSYVPSEFPEGCTTPEFDGETDGGTYAFTMTRTSARGWEIDSTGRDNDTEVERRAIGLFVERPLVDVALYADLLINFRGSNAADSYTSDTENVAQADSWCTGKGYIATNGDLDLSGVSGGPCHTMNRTIDQGFLYDTGGEDIPGATAIYPGGDRCEHAGGGGGANCRTVSEESPEYLEPARFDDPLDLNQQQDAVDFIDEALAECSPTPGQYRTSTGNADLDPGVLSPGGFPNGTGDERIEFPGELDPDRYHCFDSLYFDTDTRIEGASAKDPVIIVANRVTVKGQAGPGGPANVGCEDNGDLTCRPGGPDGLAQFGFDASRPEAARLWIFVAGDIDLKGSSAFSGVLWGPNSTCFMGSQGDVYGSLICDSLPSNLGGWRFHFDEELADVSSGEYFFAGWREPTRAE